MRKETSDKNQMIAKTMAGLENILEKELKKCGAKDTQVLKRAVSFIGNKEIMYRANYCCRTAIAILKPIYHFKARNKEELYDKLYAIKWDKYMDVDNTFAIDTIVSGDLFSHSLYLSQLCKDALVDNFRDQYNVRPSVDRAHPELRFTLRISDSDCSILIDSSGDSLYRRGYRLKHGEANLNEVLAAGMIMIAGWRGDCNFYDPMCGSGTLGIEAAMISQNIPAGYYRKKYGFMNWKDYDENLWNKIKDDENSKIEESDIEIFSSDIMSYAIDSAKKNAENAKLHHDIKFQTIAFQNTKFPETKGIIIINPPYGERLPLEDVRNFYQSIGDAMKNNCKGYDVWIISSGKDSTKFIGLKPSKKYTLFNGSIECTYAKFEIFEGKRKEFLSDNQNKI
jgi:putative N6-adenine-specific DNA methylase